MYKGYLLFCDEKTKQKCLSHRLLTYQEKAGKPPVKIKPGSVVFLYNLDNKSLIGPFTALTEGGDELDAGAWVMSIEEETLSENINVTWEDLHILKAAPSKLPFLKSAQTCVLTATQTQRILALLRQSELYLYSQERALT